MVPDKVVWLRVSEPLMTASACLPDPPCDIVTWIWVMNETDKWTDADTIKCEGTLSIYSAIEHPGHMLGDLPDQDLNDDGLPDEGQKPVFCVPFTGLLRRINLMPPCTPTPMPGPGQP